MNQRVPPYEAGLGAFINLDNGDFVGKAALAEADQRSRLHGLRCESGVPAYGTKVRAAGKTIGRVLSSAGSPLLRCGIGYVQFFGSDDWLGNDVTVVHHDSTELKGAVASLPFYHPERDRHEHSLNARSSIGKRSWVSGGGPNGDAKREHKHDRSE